MACTCGQSHSATAGDTLAARRGTNEFESLSDELEEIGGLDELSGEADFEFDAFEAFGEIDGAHADMEEIGRQRLRRISPRRPPPPKRPRPAGRPVQRPLIRQPRRSGRGAAWEPVVSNAPSGSEYLRWVQHALNQALGLQLPVNGVMDMRSRSALRSFQTRENLPVTGIAGPDTKEALIRALAPAGPDEATAEPPADDASEFEFGDFETGSDGEISRSSRDYIRWVQQSLNQISHLRLAVDGIAGEQTRSAIRDFQRRNGLSADGIVGPLTEAALLRAGAPPVPGTSYAPPPPVPASRCGQTTNWAAASREAREHYIMGLLVNTHGYSANAAAGMVGNFWHESQLIPNRLECSAAATPMRAKDFDGRTVDFSADAIMNRSSSARRGPEKPGIGLAQWTYFTRRIGLFAHPYRGVVQGACIVFDLDAQVDYAVWELANKYPAVERVLRRSGVTLNEACDEMLFAFEIPGSVLGRSRSDPAVFKVRDERRGAAQHALSSFQSASQWELADSDAELQDAEFEHGFSLDELEAETGPQPGGEPSIIDLTAQADRTRRKRTRDPKTVYALVLHQMGCCFNRKDPLKSFLKLNAHFAILPDGRILQLHPVSAYLFASNGFNGNSVAVEFAGNFPSDRGRWWQGEKFGKNRVTPAQLASGRVLVRHLIRTMGLTHILAHRQSSGTRGNDPGPDIWSHVGQWAVDTLGLKDGGPGFKVGSGTPIPSSWRSWTREAGPGAPVREADYYPALNEISERDFDLASVPAPVRSLIGRGAQLWRKAVQGAVKAGILDENRLTDIVFHMHRPQRKGRKISSAEPDFQALSAQWLQYRNDFVRPLVNSITHKDCCLTRQACRAGPDAVARRAERSPTSNTWPDAKNWAKGSLRS